MFDRLCKPNVKLYLKALGGCFIFCIIFLFNSSICFAGSIPEDLLCKDYPVYFGEVKAVDGDGVTVVQTEKIKGIFSKGSEITYPDYVFTEAPQIGEVYLCGYFDSNNPLYIWEVDCLDTDTLVIRNADAMSKRMQGYLNEGRFKDAEQKRLEAVSKDISMRIKRAVCGIGMPETALENNRTLGVTLSQLLKGAF